MNYFTTELASIGIFVLCGLVLSLILFIAVYMLSFTSKVEFEKSSAYECGFVPFEEASSSTFTVQFSLIAIIFLLFDIEVLYLYPIITSVLDLSVYELLILAAFFFILAVGIVYEISRQVMNMGETSSYKAITTGDFSSGASHSHGFNNSLPTSLVIISCPSVIASMVSESYSILNVPVSSVLMSSVDLAIFSIFLYLKLKTLNPMITSLYKLINNFKTMYSLIISIVTLYQIFYKAVCYMLVKITLVLLFIFRITMSINKILRNSFIKYTLLLYIAVYKKRFTLKKIQNIYSVEGSNITILDSLLKIVIMIVFLEILFTINYA